MLALLLVLHQPTRADPATASAIRVTEPMRLDGLLRESFWARVAPLTGFRQRQPDVGRPATDSTEVRIAYDNTTLYIGIVAFAPSGITARILLRDRLLGSGPLGGIEYGSDDVVAILLDTFHDHRNAFVFATNPNGAEFDGLLADEGRDFNVDWRGVWSVRAARFPGGWSAEFAIPFRTLRYPAGTDPKTWGINVGRMVRARNEESLWRAWARDAGLHRVSQAGNLEGLTSLPTAGGGIELKPYLLTSATEHPAHGVGLGKTGLDAKWEVRPGLTLDVTSNTDFAQVEADSQQVNLTRFSLFYPEKRDFFLENSAVFNFGIRGLFEPPPLLLFFSRRIGFSDSGPVPLVGGGRLTGRVGHETIGLLDAVTDVTRDQSGSNYAVARLKHDLGVSGYFGAVVADVHRANGLANTAAGLDALLYLSSRVSVQALVAGSHTTPDSGDGAAYRLGIRYQGNVVNIIAFTYGITPDMKVDAGFMPRADVRRGRILSRVTPRLHFLGLRDMDIWWDVNGLTRWNAVTQEWRTGPYVDFNWRSGETFSVHYFTGREWIDSSFEMSDRVTVIPGKYRSEEMGTSLATSNARPVSVSGEVIRRNVYAGEVTSASGGLRLEAGRHLSLEVGGSRSWVRLPRGRFIADLSHVRATCAFTTHLALYTLAQFDGLGRAVSGNVRLNYTFRPGSDFFIVFNELRGSDRSVWDFSQRGAVIKIAYLSRL